MGAQEITLRLLLQKIAKTFERRLVEHHLVEAPVSYTHLTLPTSDLV